MHRDRVPFRQVLIDVYVGASSTVSMVGMALIYPWGSCLERGEHAYELTLRCWR
jgi:hypothetical protein